jgi:hypothetical protein
MESRHKIEDIHLSDYWNIVKKRKMLVVVCTVVMVAVALMSSFLMKPVYKTTARLTVERETISSPITASRTEFADVSSRRCSLSTPTFRLLTSKPVLLMLLGRTGKREHSSRQGDTDSRVPSTKPSGIRCARLFLNPLTG